jgi:hypothetical protein
LQPQNPNEVHVLKSIRATTVPIDHDAWSSVENTYRGGVPQPPSRPEAIARGSRLALGTYGRDRLEPMDFDIDVAEPAEPQPRQVRRARTPTPVARPQTAPPAARPITAPPAARPQTAPPIAARPVARPAAPKTRSGGETVARLLYFVSGALIAAAVTLYGGQMWRKTHPAPPPIAASLATASAAIAAPHGRIELAPDRPGVARIEDTSPR